MCRLGAPEFAGVAADRRREREEKRRGRKERKKREKKEKRETGRKERREKERKDFLFECSGFRRSKPDYIVFGFFVKTQEVTDLPL